MAMSSRVAAGRSCGVRHRAFTLVELLVVIGIIALLISILLPTLSSARETANLVRCQSNLRQIAMGALMYERDWKSLPGPVLPAIMDPESITGANGGATAGVLANPYYIARMWTAPESVNRYLGARQQGFDAAGNAKYSPGPKGVWTCTSNLNLRDNAASPGGGTVPAGIYGFTYLINNQSDTNPPFFFGSHTSTNSVEQQRPKRPAEVRRASLDPQATDTAITKARREKWSVARSSSQIWMLGDIDGDNFSTTSSATFGIEVAPPLSLANEDDKRRIGLVKWKPPHLKNKLPARNYVFFDGHGETRSVIEFPANAR